MAFGTRAAWETLRTVAFGSLTSSYAAIGAPLSDRARLIKIVNLTDANVRVSFDGSTDHDIAPANGFFLYDLTTNRVRDDGLFVEVGTQVYIKDEGSAVTSGTVYLVVVYAEGGI